MDNSKRRIIRSWLDAGTLTWLVLPTPPQKSIQNLHLRNYRSRRNYRSPTPIILKTLNCSTFLVFSLISFIPATGKRDTSENTGQSLKIEPNML